MVGAARVVLLDHDRIAKALSALLVILQVRRTAHDLESRCSKSWLCSSTSSDICVLVSFLQRGDTFPAEAWLQDYVQVGIEYSVARRENNCALAKASNPSARC